MTYRELAERFRLSVCWGGCARASNERHEIGWHDPTYGEIHWLDRKTNRLGLRRFLKLATSSMMGLGVFMAEPERTYWQVVGAEELARQLHIRFPRRYADADRAFVRSRLKTVNDKETRRMLTRWSQP